MDDGSFQGYLPTSFGGSGNGFDIEAQIEAARRTVPEADKPKRTSSPHSDNDSDSDDDSDDDEDDDDDEYPISHEVIFKTHDRAVTSITVDPSGARMVTGSTDCTLKFHDFASMAPNTIRAFKSVDPTEQKGSANVETHPVHRVEFNPYTGSQMLAISATPQAKILSRDGEVLSEFVKGDMYLRDMNMTKGHISEITSGTWHPFHPDIFVTAGTDSTLRIWDVNTRNRQKEVIVHKSKQSGSAGRSRMTAVVWGSSVESQNSLLVSAAMDGSLSLWSGEGPYNRPSAEIKDAHAPDTWISGIDISNDGRLVVTRGGDDTIKIWDTRKFKTPLNTTSHPSTSSQYPTSNIIFSPSGTSILTGSAEGSLYILNTATLKPEHITPITPSPLITINWHPKLNSILTGHANGTTHILFNPKLSTPSKGALAILSKPPKRHHIDDDTSLTTDSSALGIAGDTAHLTGPSSSSSRSGAPSTIGLTASGRSRDPRRPHLPATTPFAKSAPGEDHIKKNIPLSSMREEDPRAALLKYADKAKEDPMFTKAWARTQPKTIYADASDGEEGEDGGEGPDRKRVKM